MVLLTNPLTVEFRQAFGIQISFFVPLNSDFFAGSANTTKSDEICVLYF